MAAESITLRQLNRATLDRQMLLERSRATVPEAVAQVVGLQAQQSMAPFVGLWSRVEDFHRDDLARALHHREVVKATFVRVTLHLCTRADYLEFRPTLQPMLTAASESINRGRAAGLEAAPLVEAARSFLDGRPRTFAEISEMLLELMPEGDVGAMRYAVRTHLPLVQVPIEGGWSFPGNPQFTPAEAWLSCEIPQQDRLKELFRRYLGAFGPASATDFQAWSAMPLKERIDEFRDGLTVYKDGRRELFDLPDALIPAEDTPAPVRLLPEYDNLLLSHQKRHRVIADEHRSSVYLPGLRVASTFLVDGFVAGVWRSEAGKSAARLTIAPFGSLTGKVRHALEEEAEALIRFIAPEARSHEVGFDG